MRCFMNLLKDVFSFSSWWCDCPNDRSHGGVTMELPFRSRTILRYWRFGDYLDDFLPHWSDQWWVPTPLLGWSFFRGQLLNFRVGLCSFLEECRVIRRFHDWNYPTNSEVIITMAMNHLWFLLHSSQLEFPLAASNLKLVGHLNFPYGRECWSNPSSYPSPHQHIFEMHVGKLIF